MQEHLETSQSPSDQIVDICYTLIGTGDNGRWKSGKIEAPGGGHLELSITHPRRNGEFEDSDILLHMSGLDHDNHGIDQTYGIYRTGDSLKRTLDLVRPDDLNQLLGLIKEIASKK